MTDGDDHLDDDGITTAQNGHFFMMMMVMMISMIVVATLRCVLFYVDDGGDDDDDVADDVCVHGGYACEIRNLHKQARRITLFPSSRDVRTHVDLRRLGVIVIGCVP